MDAAAPAAAPRIVTITISIPLTLSAIIQPIAVASCSMKIYDKRTVAGDVDDRSTTQWKASLKVSDIGSGVPEITPDKKSMLEFAAMGKLNPQDMDLDEDVLSAMEKNGAASLFELGDTTKAKAGSLIVAQLLGVGADHVINCPSGPNKNGAIGKLVKKDLAKLLAKVCIKLSEDGTDAIVKKLLLNVEQHNAALEEASKGRAVEALNSRGDAPSLAGDSEAFLRPTKKPRCSAPSCSCKKKARARAAKESEIPNFKGSYLGHFPLVSADFWTSDHLSERSRSMDPFLERARAERSR